jgi:molecular chaperone GrpE
VSENKKSESQPAATSPNPPAGTRTVASSLTEQLQAAIDDRDAFQQKWLLAVADFDNYRRRMQKELEQERRYAALPLARDLLPALDNLQRALEAARISQDAAKLIEGVQMVARQFDEILAKNSVVPINAVDQAFDPNLHQALQQVPTNDKPPMTVLTECERGFTLHDRVVRPSTVIVSAPAVPPEGQSLRDSRE